MGLASLSSRWQGLGALGDGSSAGADWRGGSGTCPGEAKVCRQGPALHRQSSRGAGAAQQVK